MLNPGATLPNGGVVLAAKPGIVLAVVPGNRITPFAVWRVTEETGVTVSGWYARTLDEARDDFRKRN